MGLIFLTGMTGSGKTAVGEELAAMLGLPFVDLDAEVASGARRNITRIFDEDGEARFRQLESEALRRVLSVTRRAVVALGAGALQSGDNLRAVMTAGTLVYLEADISTLSARLGDVSERPMLAGAESTEEIRRRLTEMLTHREPAYLRAHVIADARSEPRQVAEAIAEQLNRT